MELFTSDGLPLGTAPSAATALPPGQGEQLVVLYQLFLRLHAAGKSDAALARLMKPQALETQQRVPLESPSSPLSAAAMQLGQHNVPFPYFLLPAPALPPVTGLRGYAGSSAVAAPGLGEAEVATAGAPHNTNRSANGAEEIPMRARLLPREAPGATSSVATAAWRPAELQVETSARRLYCTATELPTGGEGAEYAPLAFVCGASESTGA